YLPESPEGNPLGWVARYQNSRDKQIIPFFKPGSRKGTFKAGGAGDPRPLFGLPTIHQPGPIFVTEGEKDAAALHLVGISAVTSPGGSNAATKADWMPLACVLKTGRRSVIVWPDNDDPGRKYAVTVANQVGAGCRCLAQPLQHIDGAGAADWIAAELQAYGIEWDGLEVIKIDVETQDAVRNALQAALQAVLGPIPAEWLQRHGEGAQRQPRAKESPHESEGPLYLALDAGVFLVNAGGQKQLCNFTALIEEEISRDDGQEKQLQLIVSGRRGGKPLPNIALTFEQFTAMAWPMKHWGTRCMVYPGQAVKEQLRHAVQMLSHRDREVPDRTIYAHTGWRKLDSGWVYLSAGSVIGAGSDQEGIEVDLGELGELYRLPPASTSSSAAREAARASLQTVAVAPLEVTLPLIASAYLAPLAQSLGVDFALWLEGPSRSMKSSVAGMIAAHFGAGINRTTLTASWLDTANAIGLKLFTLADCLAVIDDYAPQPTSSDQARLDKAVHNIVRGIGNRAGRGRLTADIRLQNERKPRAMTLITAEQWPQGESINARLFGVPLQPGDVDLAALTTAQNNAASGLLAQAMADHLQRIAADFDRHKADARTELERYRAKALSEGIRGRLPDQCAFLMVGYAEALDHWRHAGVIDQATATDWTDQAWAVLARLAADHDRRILSSQPAEAFRSALTDLLLSGGAHLLGRDETRPLNAERYGWKGNEPSGQHIGWVSEQERYLFLLPNLVLQAVNELLRKIGTPLNLSPKALWRQLRDRGYLIAGNSEERNGRSITRTTRKVKIGNRALQLLTVPLWVIDQAEDHPGD
ncbi:MAG: hypothetical protein KDI08_09670, partial [Pseudomonadales bacterium]|nr:hypothetical protein [Pseudomonadales bacterium]